jgi:hypothetical protein
MKNNWLPFLQLYEVLKENFGSSKREINIPVLDVSISRRRFHSRAASLLPGETEYFCRAHSISFGSEASAGGTAERETKPEERSILEFADSRIDCNKEFDYIVIDEPGGRTSGNVILLFHGLNEKRWDKYLPWAYRLLKSTGKPVILFPLAFHMDRAPAGWSESKHMNLAAKERSNIGTGQTNAVNSHTSFVNAAISSRLEANPQRFFWSGLETYIDVTELLMDLSRGRVEGFAHGTTADIFGYSIGAYFSVILLMAGARGLTKDSRLFAFCGGPTLDRMYPISKYILDAHATTSLGSYYLELLNSGGEKQSRPESNARLWHYLSSLHEEESFFKSMLLYHHYKDLRESRLQSAAKRIHAVALRQDTVIPPVEVLNTLKGELRDIDITVEVEDFPYPYTHVTPFPLTPKYSDETNEAFTRIMDKAGKFLG